MKRIVTFDKADQPYGFAQLDASGSISNSVIPTGSLATTGSNTFTGIQVIAGSNGVLRYSGTDANTGNPGYPSLADIHANDAQPWLERFYNDTYSTSDAIMAYFGWDDGRFVFHNESTQSIGLQVNGYNGDNGLVVYEDKVVFVNNAEVTGSLVVTGSITLNGNAIDRPYKVYTALLTQSGGDNPLDLYSGAATKGVSYKVVGSVPTTDFSNIGGPVGENDDFLFVATKNEIPNNYSGAGLLYNTGAPVVTVLENTIGNIWWTFDTEGTYSANSNSLFTAGKVFSTIYSQPVDNFGDGVKFALIKYETISTNTIVIMTGTPGYQNYNSFLLNTPIEIRVYN